MATENNEGRAAATFETFYHLTMHTLNYDSCAETRLGRLLRDAELAEERPTRSVRHPGGRGATPRVRNLSHEA